MNVPKVLKKSGDAVTLIVHMDIIEPKYSIKPTGLKQYTLQYVKEKYCSLCFWYINILPNLVDNKNNNLGNNWLPGKRGVLGGKTSVADPELLITDPEAGFISESVFFKKS